MVKKKILISENLILNLTKDKSNEELFFKNSNTTLTT